jgi:hypothetical protein
MTAEDFDSVVILDENLPPRDTESAYSTVSWLLCHLQVDAHLSENQSLSVRLGDVRGGRWKLAIRNGTRIPFPIGVVVKTQAGDIR